MSTGARVLLVSIRRLNPHAAWCSNYEFEDVIRAVDDVDLLELEPAPHFELRRRVARSLAWKGPHKAFTRFNPGVKPVTIGRDYELLVFVCMNVWDLLYLNAVRDWQDRAGVKICYMVEFYAGNAQESAHLLRMLAAFDYVAQSFSGSVPAVRQIVGEGCHHVPLGADVLRFTPYPAPYRRVIDVFSVGRRAEPVHQALLRLAAARRLFYVHDTIPGPLVQPTSPREHRDMLASSAKRSRFFIAYPAKFGAEENQGQSDVGARYFEGAASGAVLLGQAPTAPAFHLDFPWPDAVVETRPDGTDVAEVLEDLAARPDDVEAMGVRNALAALRHFDWAHRWQAILGMVGATARPALAERLGGLGQIADEVERRPVNA